LSKFWQFEKLQIAGKTMTVFIDDFMFGSRVYENFIDFVTSCFFRFDRRWIGKVSSRKRRHSLKSSRRSGLYGRHRCFLQLEKKEEKSFSKEKIKFKILKF
jgi:hypothetical protein